MNISAEAQGTLVASVAAALSLPPTSVALKSSAFQPKWGCSNHPSTADTVGSEAQAASGPWASINASLSPGLDAVASEGLVLDSSVVGPLPSTALPGRGLDPGPRPSGLEVPTSLNSTIYVAATGGNDSATCGAATSPCATLRFAVNVVANAVVPVNATAVLVLGPGLYGPSSCGASAVRPMNISGAGSSMTTIDCAGTNRTLTTTASLSLAGLTLMGGKAPGLINLTSLSRVDPGCASPAPVGGGAVSVVWPPTLSSASASMLDLVFVSNTVDAVITQAGPSPESMCPPDSVVVGGGGLLVSGGGNNTVVSLQQCVFDSNIASASASVGGLQVAVSVCGGGACILPGVPAQPNAITGSPLSGVVVEGGGVVAVNNMVTGCSSGETGASACAPA